MFKGYLASTGERNFIARTNLQIKKHNIAVSNLLLQRSYMNLFSSYLSTNINKDSLHQGNVPFG